jgi:hypothetical protein
VLAAPDAGTHIDLVEAVLKSARTGLRAKLRS